ncbi:MAG: hypothetical protein IT555_06265 [Acetobacteraceae bacterium]|nr:hypothetical protein [Acetobacteraceae bacterium]
MADARAARRAAGLAGRGEGFPAGGGAVGRTGVARGGELAGLPELDQVFEAGDQPGERGEDEGAQRGEQPVMVCCRRAQVGGD